MPRLESTLLSAAAEGSSAAVGVVGLTDFSLYIKAANVTAGATVKIEARMPSGDWAVTDSRQITASGDTVLQFAGPHLALRATVTDRTDGTYTVGLVAVKLKKKS